MQLLAASARCDGVAGVDTFHNAAYRMRLRVRRTRIATRVPHNLHQRERCL